MTDKKQRDIFRKNLNELMDKRQLTQAEVAKAIDVSPQTFNTWMQGIAIPRIGKIQAIADYFGVQKSTLLDEKPLPKNLIPISKAKAIPIIGTICAGTGLVAFEERLGVFSLDANIHADYSLYVKGNSMIGADIQDGDLAFFERDFEYEDGAIYAVLRKDTEEAILRRVTVADGKMVLSPCNDDFVPIIANSDDIELLARLNGVFRER